MGTIQSETIVTEVDFRRNRLQLMEYYNDNSVATSLQIRLDDDGEISIFVSDYDRKLKNCRITYKELKQELLKIIKNKDS